MIPELYIKDWYLFPRNRHQSLFVRAIHHGFKIHPLGIHRCELPIYNNSPSIWFNFTPHLLKTKQCNRIRACIKRQIKIFLILLVREKTFKWDCMPYGLKKQKSNTEHIFVEESQQCLMPRNASAAASGLFCCTGC